MSKVKLSLVGLGHWGNIIKKTIETNLNDICEIVSLVDTKYKGLIKINKVFPYNESLCGDAIKDSDAVIICTPPPNHFESIQFCLSNNKHVFAEKPITLCYTSARDLYDLSVEKNKVLMVDSTFCFSPEIIWIKNALELNRFGIPKLVRSIRTNYGPFNNHTNVIMDLMVHDVSLIYELFGGVKYVSATGTTIRNENIIDDCRATLTTPKGLQVDVHASWLSKNKVRFFEILTTQGWLSTNFNGYVSFDSFEGECKSFEVEKISPLEIELRHFVNTIIDGNKYYKSNGVLAAEHVRVLGKIVDSVKSGGKEIIL